LRVEEKDFPRVVILSGPAGSGKTEISINLAILFSQKGEVAVADLDIIKPLFRLRDFRGSLQALQIHILSPGGKWDKADLPILSGKARKWLVSENRVILDLGGEGSGARVIKQYRELLTEGSYSHYFVCNPFRPFSKIVELRESLKMIEGESGLSVSGLISNPHLKEHTNSLIIANGHAVVQELAQQEKLPIIFLTVKKELVSSVEVDIPVLPLRIFVRSPWEN